MSTPDQSPNDVSFFVAFKRPAWAVMMAAQFILGLGLFVALVVKYYMLINGAAGCLPDADTLANMLRCTPTLNIVAHFIFAVAGMQFAAFFFQDRPTALLRPLLLSVAGVFINFISGVSTQSASWASAATILVLMVGLTTLFGARYVLQSQKQRNDQSTRAGI